MNDPLARPVTTSTVLYQVGLYDPLNPVAPIELLDGCFSLGMCRAIVGDFNRDTADDPEIIDCLGIFPVPAIK